MRALSIIVGLIFMIIGIALFGYGLYTALTLEKNTTGKYVDCYDNHNNKIIGEVCYDKGISESDLVYNKLTMFWIFTILASIFFMLGLMVSQMGETVL